MFRNKPWQKNKNQYNAIDNFINKVDIVDASNIIKKLEEFNEFGTLSSNNIIFGNNTTSNKIDISGTISHLKNITFNKSDYIKFGNKFIINKQDISLNGLNYGLNLNFDASNVIFYPGSNKKINFNCLDSSFNITANYPFKYQSSSDQSGITFNSIKNSKNDSYYPLYLKNNSAGLNQIKVILTNDCCFNCISGGILPSDICSNHFDTSNNLIILNKNKEYIDFFGTFYEANNNDVNYNKNFSYVKNGNKVFNDIIIEHIKNLPTIFRSINLIPLLYYSNEEDRSINGNDISGGFYFVPSLGKFNNYIFFPMDSSNNEANPNKNVLYSNLSGITFSDASGIVLDYESKYRNLWLPWNVDVSINVNSNGGTNTRYIMDDINRMSLFYDFSFNVIDSVSYVNLDTQVELLNKTIGRSKSKFTTPDDAQRWRLYVSGLKPTRADVNNAALVTSFFPEGTTGLDPIEWNSLPKEDAWMFYDTSRPDHGGKPAQAEGTWANLGVNAPIPPDGLYAYVKWNNEGDVPDKVRAATQNTNINAIDSSYHIENETTETIKARDISLNNFFKHVLEKAMIDNHSKLYFKGTHKSDCSFNYSMDFYYNHRNNPKLDSWNKFKTKIENYFKTSYNIKNDFNTSNNDISLNWYDNQYKIFINSTYNIPEDTSQNPINLYVEGNGYLNLNPTDPLYLYLYGFEFNTLTNITDIDFVYKIKEHVSARIFLLYHEPTTDSIETILHIDASFNPYSSDTDVADDSEVPLTNPNVPYSKKEKEKEYTVLFGKENVTFDKDDVSFNLIKFLNKNGPTINLNDKTNPQKSTIVENYKIYLHKNPKPAKTFFIAEYIDSAPDNVLDNYLDLQYIRLKANVYDVNNIVRYYTLLNDLSNCILHKDNPIFYPSDDSGNELESGIYRWYDPYYSKELYFDGLNATWEIKNMNGVLERLNPARLSGYYGTNVPESYVAGKKTHPPPTYSTSDYWTDISEDYFTNYSDEYLKSWALFDSYSITDHFSQNDNITISDFINYLSDHSGCIYNRYYDISAIFFNPLEYRGTVINSSNYDSYNASGNILNFFYQGTGVGDATQVINMCDYLDLGYPNTTYDRDNKILNYTFKLSKPILLSDLFIRFYIYNSQMEVEIYYDANDDDNYTKILKYTIGGSPKGTRDWTSRDTAAYIYIPNTSNLNQNRVIYYSEQTRPPQRNWQQGTGSNIVSSKLCGVNNTDYNNQLYLNNNAIGLSNSNEILSPSSLVDAKLNEPQGFTNETGINYYKRQEKPHKKFKIKITQIRDNRFNTFNWGSNFGISAMFNGILPQQRGEANLFGHELTHGKKIYYYKKHWNTLDTDTSYNITFDTSDNDISNNNFYSNILGDTFDVSNVYLNPEPQNMIFIDISSNRNRDISWCSDISRPNCLIFKFNKYTVINEFDIIMKIFGIKSNYCLCYLNELTEKITPILFYRINYTNSTSHGDYGEKNFVTIKNPDLSCNIYPEQNGDDMSTCELQQYLNINNPSISIKIDSPQDSSGGWLIDTNSRDPPTLDWDGDQRGLIYLKPQQAPAKKFYLFGKIKSDMLHDTSLIHNNFMHYARMNGDIYDDVNDNTYDKERIDYNKRLIKIFGSNPPTDNSPGDAGEFIKAIPSNSYYNYDVSAVNRESKRQISVPNLFG